MANIKDAVYLIDDDNIFNWGDLRSGWDFINDCADYHAPAEGASWLLRADGTGSVTLRRDCNRFEGGMLTLETKLANLSGDGFKICLGTRNSAFLTLVTVGEQLFIGNAPVGAFPFGAHQLRVEADMCRRMARVWIGAKCCGEFAFDGEGEYFDCLRYCYDTGSVGEAKLTFAKLYVNFLLNDYNFLEHTGDLPDGYTVVTDGGARVVSEIRPSHKNEYAYISKNPAGASSAVSAAFPPSGGVTALEIKYLQPEAKGTVKITLAGADITVWDAGEQLMLGTTPLRSHHSNVWQTLRIAADTEKGSAVIWLNGKKTTEAPCAAAPVTGFTITYEATEESIMMFSDIKAWVIPEEPADYVPAPAVPKKQGDYVVGLNICSLWREGTHKGWDCITPYADIDTVLGCYDEGLPETSDWEIKFMLEHGIDYELYCWYSAEVREPIKSTHLHYAWLDGHFYAKYADQMPFALLWEAANCAHPTCLDDFKANLVPYWLDYFFSDPRYMRIDNKAVMSCFGVWCVEKDLGGAEYVREGLQYLRDEVKKLGYDDLIVMGCHADPKQLKNLGFDAFHAYHWGADGYKLETNIKSNNDNIAMNGAHIIPTVSVGFKNIGWGGERRPNLSAQDMYNGLVYCRDELLPKFKSDDPKDAWKSRMLHLSTWNEYGEGTYMMPSGLNGFGYLDAVRKAICIDEPHVDIVPTEAQKARICYLRPQSRYMLGRTKYDTRPRPENAEPLFSFEFKTEADLAKWKFVNMADIRIENGRLCGKNTEHLAYMDLCDLDIDAADIAYGEVVQANVNNHTKAPTQAYIAFSKKPDCSDCGIKGATVPFWNTSFTPISYSFDLDTQRWWNGKIRGIRLYATFSGTFEVERITLYAAKPHVCVYDQAGRQLYFGSDYIETKNGEPCIPLDPESGMIKALGFHHEWHRDEARLELYKGERRIDITVGKAYARIDGENYTLARPAYCKDGIPTLTLSDMKLVFGDRFTLDGTRLTIN